MPLPSEADSILMLLRTNALAENQSAQSSENANVLGISEGIAQTNEHKFSNEKNENNENNENDKSEIENVLKNESQSA